MAKIDDFGGEVELEESNGREFQVTLDFQPTSWHVYERAPTPERVVLLVGGTLVWFRKGG